MEKALPGLRYALFSMEDLVFKKISKDPLWVKEEFLDGEGPRFTIENTFAQKQKVVYGHTERLNLFTNRQNTNNG